MKTFARFALLPLLLTGQAHAAETFTYRCADGQALVVSYAQAADGRPQAILHRPGGDLLLPGVAAASGARYHADPVDLHSKGDELLYTDDRVSQLRCTHGAPPSDPTPSPTAASSFITLRGGVAYRTRNALPPDAILVIRVQDISGTAPARLLAEQRYELNGTQVPVFFTTTVDRDLIGKRARVEVAARIEAGGRLRYINNRAYPALQDGQPLPLSIMLKPVAPIRH